MRVPHISALLTLLLVACTIEAQPTETGIQSSAEFQLASSVSSSVASAPVTPSIAERTLSGGILEIGRANADVTMQLFINYSSPYSKQFSDTYLPWLISDFVTAGDLKIQIIPVSFVKYPRSSRDTSLLACGAADGKGHAMNSLLFTQPADALIAPKLTELGLDAKKIADCVQGDIARQAVATARGLAQRMSVTVVPTYIINDTTYTGLPEYADLKGQIRSAQ